MQDDSKELDGVDVTMPETRINALPDSVYDAFRKLTDCTRE
jgi:hypothetical protein